MNILFFNKFYPHPSSGGIERVTMTLAKWFSEQGHKCFSVYFKKSEFDDCWDYVKGVYAENLWDEHFWRAIFSEYHTNIVINQSHWWITPFLSRITHRYGSKYIFCLHTTTNIDTVRFSDAIRGCGTVKGMAIKLVYPMFRWYSLRKLLKGHQLNYTCSDKVIILAKSAIQDYSKICRAKSEDGKLDFINNPLSFKCVFPEQDIHKKQKIVLIVARLSKEKRVDLALEAWKRIEDAGYYNWQLKIVGDGECSSRLKHLASQLNLRNISFEGLKESENYYKEASLYCMTSESEGFPMTILESLQMGVVPIVMDSFPAAKDLIEDGYNGVLVPYLDIDRFAEKLKWLMENDDIRREMALKAIESSRQYDIEKIGGKWVEMINQFQLK